jgi:hypothetical protein
MANGVLLPALIEETKPDLRQRASRTFVYLTLLGVASYLYLNLFLLPNIPILLSGDQVFFWMNGQRMFYGERPYQDFFQFTPPGADIFYFSVFKMFGPEVWVLNGVVLALGVALCWICFTIANKVMERHLALLATLLFLTLIYTKLLNATHHWFSVFAIMAGIALLLSGINAKRLAAAGLLFGFASFFTQTHGTAALLAVTVLLAWNEYGAEAPWQRFWRNERLLLLGFVVAVIALNLHYVATVGLKRLWYFQVTYVRKVMVHRPETALLGMPEAPHWRMVPLPGLAWQYSQYFFVYLMLPLIYFLVLRGCWRGRKSPTIFRSQIALVALTGSALLAELVFSLNWLRLYAVSMPGIILFVWTVSTIRKGRKYALAAVWTGILILAVQQTWSAQRHDYKLAQLPAGNSATEPEQSEKLDWLMQRTKPGDFFFQANWPGMYVPLGLRNPVFLDTAGTMAEPQWAEIAVQQLESKQVHFVLWSSQLDYPVNPSRPRTTHIVPLRAYLRSTYHPVRIFPDGDEIWERK